MGVRREEGRIEMVLRRERIRSIRSLWVFLEKEVGQKESDIATRPPLIGQLRGRPIDVCYPPGEPKSFPKKIELIFFFFSEAPINCWFSHYHR